jgi:hypothetical protein
MVDLGADGDPDTRRVISKESAIGVPVSAEGPAALFTLRSRGFGRAKL